MNRCTQSPSLHASVGDCNRDAAKTLPHWTKDSHFRSAFGIVSVLPPSFNGFHSHLFNFFRSFWHHILLDGNGIIAQKSSFNFHRRRRRRRRRSKIIKKRERESDIRINFDTQFDCVCAFAKENKLNFENAATFKRRTNREVAHNRQLYVVFV